MEDDSKLKAKESITKAFGEMSQLLCDWVDQCSGVDIAAMMLAITVRKQFDKLLNAFIKESYERRPPKGKA